MSDSLPPHGLKPAKLHCPWNFPGKNIGVDLSFPSAGGLPDPRIEPASSSLAGSLSHQGSPFSLSIQLLSETYNFPFVYVE